MKTISQFVKTTIVGGLFFMAPIVVLFIIIAKAFDYAKKGLNAVLVHVPAASDLSAGAATVLSVLVVALVCFLAGLVARSVTAQRVAEIGELPVVFVPMEGGWQLGVRTEALSNDLISVFIPGAPDPHSGSVFFFSADSVRPAGVKMAAALNCLRRCGAGASALSATWPTGA